jgi:uncharacterized RDD family membrane protein YckC
MNETTNPYEPPKADVSLGGGGVIEPEDLPDASRGARFANFIIDNVARFVFAAIVATVIGIVRPDPSETVATILVLVSFLGYYVILESAFGWTVGKLITGTRVITEDGDKPGFLRVCGRTLARFIPFEPFSVLFGATPSGWHDSLSGTRVVKVRR